MQRFGEQRVRKQQIFGASFLKDKESLSQRQPMKVGQEFRDLGLPLQKSISCRTTDIHDRRNDQTSLDDTHAPLIHFTNDFSLLMPKASLTASSSLSQSFKPIREDDRL